MVQSYIIGIVGPSGAGKSTLCKMLKKEGKDFEHIKLDNYFKSPKTFPKKHGFANWELPTNLKFKQLLSDLKKLKKGLVVKTKSFPKKHGAKPEPLTLRPKKFILVEGFMLYKSKEVRDFLDKKIYLELSPKGMIERRKIRFRQNHSNEYDLKVAIPEFLKYGVTQKKYADHIVDASRTQTEVVRDIKKLLLM